MLKTKLAGAAALAVVMAFSLFPAPQAHSAPLPSVEHLAGVRVTEGHIAQLRAALNLRPDQHRYWAPVETALRSIARQQNGQAAPESARRVALAARELIGVLDASQRRNALMLVRYHGFDRLVSAYY